jgi:hypothetical protein
MIMAQRHVDTNYKNTGTQCVQRAVTTQQMFECQAGVANPSRRALPTEQESYHTCADCCINRNLSCLWIHLSSASIKEHEAENSEPQHKELDLTPHINDSGPLGSCIGSRHAHLAGYITYSNRGNVLVNATLQRVRVTIVAVEKQ